MSRAVEELPVDLSLWKNAVLVVTETNRLYCTQLSKNQFKLEVEEYYRWMIADAKTPQDIEKIRTRYEQQGYISKIPKRRKQARNVRHNRAQSR